MTASTSRTWCSTTCATTWEVQSTGIAVLGTLIADDRDNRRQDGSETNIQRLPPDDEDHVTVDEPTSKAFAWVVDRMDRDPRAGLRSLAFGSL